MAFRNLTGPLSRLFRSDSTPVENTDGAQIAANAVTDDDSASRDAAIEKLPDGAALRQLAGISDTLGADTAPDLELKARARLAQLVDAGTVDFGGLLSDAGASNALLSTIALCVTTSHLETALASIDDPLRIAALVTDGESSRVRLLAAQRIDDPAELKNLLKHLRGKDKSVYRIIQAKCDALRAEEQRVAQTAGDTEAACATLERLSHRLYDPLYEASMRISIDHWRALEPQATAAVQERAQTAIAACLAVVAEHVRQLDERAAKQAALKAEHAARLEAAALAETQAQEGREAAALVAAAVKQQQDADAAVKAELDAAHGAQLRQLTGLIARTHAALRDGDTGRAAGMRRSLEEKIPKIAEIPAHVTRQVQQLDEKLAELKQWKDFAVAPKRAELIAEMEGLIGSTEAPQALADRIKQLQEDWKTISKGIVSDSEADWQRFHQASQTAYLPCKAYFETQSKLRQTNLDKRSSVLERVKTFENSFSTDSPDWRILATVLREAPQEFRRYSPVDRAAGRRLQDALDTTLERLRERIDAWYAQNAAEKQTLIQRAKLMLEKSDHREAAEGIKNLQGQWKNIGSAEHRDEQRLWEDFRAQCDAVFARRQKAFTDQAVALDANKLAAVALCEDAEQAAALSGHALVESVAKISQWRDAFEALGELPRADQRTLQNRFDRAVKQCQTQLSQQRTRDQEQSYAYLLEAARLIHVYGWAVASAAAADETETLKLAAEAFIANVATWPKGAASALKDAWGKAREATVTASTANEAAMRMLCIRSEILTERSTPAEDSTLRREYQVKRLMQRMGHGQDHAAEDLHTLALDWVRVGPVAATAAEPLRTRFLRCRGVSG